MNYDQMCGIIDDTFVPKWDKIPERWTKKLLREVVFPAMREFREEDARTAAYEIFRSKRFAPDVEEWASEARKAAAVAGRHHRKAHANCPYCGGSGFLLASYHAEKNLKSGRRRMWGWDHYDRQYTDPKDVDGYRRYGGTIPCTCSNTPQGWVKTDAERDYWRMVREKVSAACEEWEAQRQRGPKRTPAQVKAMLANVGSPVPPAPARAEVKKRAVESESCEPDDDLPF